MSFSTKMSRREKIATYLAAILNMMNETVDLMEDAADIDTIDTINIKSIRRGIKDYYDSLNITLEK